VGGERRWLPHPMSAPSGRASRPSSVPSTPNTRYGLLPMTPHTIAANLPSTPSSPVSNTSSDYFGAHSRKASTQSLMLPSPVGGDVPLPSTDGGPVRRVRTASQGRVPTGPFSRPAHRKRQSADGSSAHSSSEHIPTYGDGALGTRMCWSLDVGDVCVWSIVSTEQITYTFFVPDYVGQQRVTEPFAPFPVANRLLPPNVPTDHGPAHLNHHFTSRTDQPLVTM
jgi:recombining binding protein (suppressor of hairless)